MKKTIRKIEYDTDASALVKKFTFGAFGDSDGYEESLYQTERGLYFLYVNGGENSPYTVEDIRQISKEKAAEWIENH